MYNESSKWIRFIRNQSINLTLQIHVDEISRRMPCEWMHQIRPIHTVPVRNIFVGHRLLWVCSNAMQCNSASFCTRQVLIDPVLDIDIDIDRLDSNWSPSTITIQESGPKSLPSRALHVRVSYEMHSHCTSLNGKHLNLPLESTDLPLSYFFLQGSGICIREL
jgi:hypothetical protein